MATDLLEDRIVTDDPLNTSSFDIAEFRGTDQKLKTFFTVGRTVSERFSVTREAGVSSSKSFF